MMRWKTISWTFYIVCCFMMLIASCSGPGGNPSGGRLSTMNIANATNLFVAPSNGAKGSANKLFKVTSSGYVQQVTFTDDSGNATSIESVPTAVYNAAVDYIVVCFGSDGYLVRKSDGAVFTLDAVGLPYVGINGFKNDKIVKSDGLGNIYFIVQNRLCRIQTSNLNSLTGTYCSPNTDLLDNFVVTADGQVAYSYPDANKNLSGRIRMSNGGLSNLGGNYILWIGIDGKIRSTGFGSNVVGTVNIDASFAVTTSSVTGSFSAIYEYSSYLLKLGARTLIVGPDSIVEVENPNNLPRTVLIPQLNSRTFAGNSASYYYVAGTDANNNPTLLRVDPTNDGATTLLPKDGVYYEIYAMTVSADDIVVFNALRMADGAKVIGQINASGLVTILDTTIDSQVVCLERIN